MLIHIYESEEILVKNVTIWNMSVGLAYKKIVIEMKEFRELAKRRERKEGLFTKKKNKV